MSEHEVHEVRIHIDRKAYMSPRVTTHAALYTLGHIPSGYELFLEVHGDHEDKPIPNDQDKIELKEDQHFYSAQPGLERTRRRLCGCPGRSSPTGRKYGEAATAGWSCFGPSRDRRNSLPEVGTFRTPRRACTRTCLHPRSAQTSRGSSAAAEDLRRRLLFRRRACQSAAAG